MHGSGVACTNPSSSTSHLVMKSQNVRPAVIVPYRLPSRNQHRGFPSAVRLLNIGSTFMPLDCMYSESSLSPGGRRTYTSGSSFGLFP